MQNGQEHLTYCTNVHKGETWEDVFNILQTDLLAVRQAVAPMESFGVGLRLSGQALATASEPPALDTMKQYLADNDLYVFTMNAFPYGPFHGTRVKQDVYLPDWRDEERLRYTNASADYLANFLPENMKGSVSTAPGCFRTNVASEQTVADMASRFVRSAAHLVDLHRKTGKRIALAIEPEPSCFLETTNEAIAFFKDFLFGSTAVAELSRLCGLPRGEAETALRTHLGLCLDLCHAAVEYEEPAETYAALRAAGISVTKMQVSAGLRLTEVSRETPSLLSPFDDGVYLHQVIERRGKMINRYPDLADAFAALKNADDNSDREWRIHYHVPLFLADLEPFSSTQDFVCEALALHRLQPISSHLEVETYTWGVLPPTFRTAGLVPSIAREIEWVRQQLQA